MRENKYDDEAFFFKYGQMERSLHGLSGAGEWYALKPLLPDFKDRRVLDLGCGYGWHCAYAIEQGAKKSGRRGYLGAHAGSSAGKDGFPEY